MKEKDLLKRIRGILVLAIVLTGFCSLVCAGGLIFEIQEAELEQLKKLLSEGYSIRECAEEMGLSKSTAHRLKKKLEAE